MRRTDDRREQTTPVTIFGAEYVLSSAESEAYTRQISAFVDERMKHIANEMNLGDTTKVAIMAALEIAGQLLDQQKRRLSGEARASEAIARLGQYLDDATKDDEAA